MAAPAASETFYRSIDHGGSAAGQAQGFERKERQWGRLGSAPGGLPCPNILLTVETVLARCQGDFGRSHAVWRAVVLLPREWRKPEFWAPLTPNSAQLFVCRRMHAA